MTIRSKIDAMVLLESTFFHIKKTMSEPGYIGKKKLESGFSLKTRRPTRNCFENPITITKATNLTKETLKSEYTHESDMEIRIIFENCIEIGLTL